MFLDSNKKLTAVLTTAKTTLNMPVTVDFVDLSAINTTAAPNQIYTNGITPVDILSAPAASTTRKVNGLTIYGRDTAAKTVRVYTIDSTPTTGLITAGAFVDGNDYQIVSVGTTDFTLIGATANTIGVIFTASGVGTGTGTAATAYQHLDLQLQIDDTLCYTDVNGWYTVDSQGNLKSVQAASATAIATAIHGSTNKATPVGADELGIWDSVSGLLNKISFTSLWAQLSGLYASLTSVAGYPTVASAATTMDIFGAAGVTISVSGTTTVTAIPNCTAGQVGSTKTIIPSNAAGFSITASASLEVDGAMSGTFLMPKDANIQILATSVSTFKITTMSAHGTWVPTALWATQGTGAISTLVYGTYSKTGNMVSLSAYFIATKGTASGAFTIGGIPISSPNVTSVTFRVDGAGAASKVVTSTISGTEISMLLSNQSTTYGTSLTAAEMNANTYINIQVNYSV